MTAAQIGLFLLLAMMLAGFGFGRFRYELVALSGLAAAVLLGFVPADTVFMGLSSPTVVTVIEILLIVQALANAKVIGIASRALAWLGNDRRRIVVCLCALGAFLSAFMNNIGALALVMPLAASLSERHGLPLREILMPLSFATLLGGLCTVIGTPANLIGSEIMEQARGQALGFFEIGVIGLPLTLAGLGYIYFTTAGGRTSAPDQSGEVEDTRLLALEAEVPASSPLIGRSLESLRAEDRISVHNILRDGRFVFGGSSRTITAGDRLVMTAPRPVMDRLLASKTLAIRIDEQAMPDISVTEAVVLPDSIYVGSAVDDLFLTVGDAISIQALGIAPRRIEGRFSDIRLAVGDVLVMRGKRSVIEAECAESGLLPVATTARSADEKADLVPVGVFAAGIAATALAGVEPSLAFGAVVLILALMGRLSLRRGLESMHWPSIIMLASMIPLGSAVAATGTAAALADLVLAAVPQSSVMALSVTMLILSVLLTPLVNNPSTVLILAPIGSAVAARYGLPAEPVILAVTIGASLDFLTPFGHHNNTLVMGVAGYSFRDFMRRGAPLVLLSLVVTIICLRVVF